MLSIRRAALLLLSLSPAAAACSDAGAEGVDAQESASSFVPKVGPAEFRSDFFAYLRRDGVSEAAAKKLVYLAPPSIAAPAVAPSAGADPVSAYDRFFSRVHPSDLYAHGLATPLTATADPDATFARSGPIHVLLVPGIFGEFIEDRPFEELLSRTESSAARRWASVTRAAAGTPRGKARRYDLGKLATEEVPIDQVIDVASLDDARGEPLVTLAYLKPGTGSLETLGSLEESTATYLPRIDAYADLMGRPKNLVVMGYSRGAAVALDLVSRAASDRAAHPWASDVVGVLSHAGVLYGTGLADATKDPDNVTGQMLREIDGLAKSLHSCSPTKPLHVAAQHRIENTTRWTGTVAKVAWLASRLPARKEIELEKIASATPDYGRLGKLVSRIAFDDALNLDKPLADYCGNVERFKRVVSTAMRGVDSLTTISRLAWWRTHVVPSHVRLFAITATMGDATRDGRVWPLTVDASVNDTRSIDFKSLRGNFYDLFAATGLDVNDSQVTLPRARFWPDVHPILNGAQSPVRAYFLGTLGTHHWGLAFPRALPTDDGLRGNPYPRTALFHAMGAFVSRAIVSERTP